ncbi:MAG: hypothetical protein AB1500_02940 [Bacillota bacterium]
MQIKQNKAVKALPGFIAGNPEWCGGMRERIQNATTKAELKSLWNKEIKPHLTHSVWSVMGSVAHFTDHTMKLRREPTGLVGQDDADALISGLNSGLDTGDGSGPPASLGPVLGIAGMARGEMDRAEYIALYGHRGPDEFELSVPRPAEKPDWLDEQLARFRESPVDVEALLSDKRAEFAAAWERFREKHPRKARSMRRRIGEVAPRGRLRESVRSEYVRDRSVARAFALRAGELTGLGDDIFFLTVEEVLNALSGGTDAVKYIPARKETYRRYLALPAYPSIIRAFRPFPVGGGSKPALRYLRRLRRRLRLRFRRREKRGNKRFGGFCRPG